MKILIADDDERNRRILNEVLKGQYELVFASDGNEALVKAIEQNPDLILLDIVMPILDGLEVCRKIRSNPSYDFTKIILVSGRAMPEERVIGYKAGADDYLIKPYNFDELTAKIQLHLKIKKTQDQFFQHSQMRMVHKQDDSNIEYDETRDSISLNIQKIKKHINWMFQLLNGYEMAEVELPEGSASLEYVKALKERIDSGDLRNEILQALESIQADLEKHKNSDTAHRSFSCRDAM